MVNIHSLGGFRSGPRILIVDDNALGRECLATALSTSYAEVRSAANLSALLHECGFDVPDLVLLNIRTRNSATLLHSILDLDPRPRIVVCGLAVDREAEIVSCAEAGVPGLHLESESVAHLITLLNAVADGKSLCSSDVSAVLLSRVYEAATGRSDQESANGALTARESEILALIDRGMTNKQIATHLSVTVHTVKNHVHNLLSKLGVGSRIAACRALRATTYAGQVA